MFVPLAFIVLAIQPGQPAAPALRPIESNTVDATPLMEPLRLVPLDLRQDVGFSKVYELRTESRLFGATDVAYARRSGNLTAFFPRSTYVQSEQGTSATVPPGTVFMIGDLTPKSASGPSVLSVPRPDLAADLFAREAPVNAAPAPARRVDSNDAPSIWDSELTRNGRLAALLDAAKLSR